MQSALKVNFIDNKKLKISTIIFLIVIFIMAECTILYFTSKTNNYSNYKSYLKFTAPILFAVFIYFNLAQKWVFKKEFILSNEGLSWALGYYNSNTYFYWTDVEKVIATKSSFQFYLKNGNLKKIAFSNFGFAQLQQLKQRIIYICNYNAINCEFSL